MTSMESGAELLKYIPQREPFVLVSDLYSHNDKSVISGFQVLEDHILVSGGRLQEGGLVENMAQTAALFAGVKSHASEGEAPIGYIASIKGLKIHRLPKVDEHIKTSVEIINEVMNIQIAKARVVDSQNHILAECEMRIFIKPD